MIDPALLAQMDQAQAGFGTWADMLVLAWQELCKRGVPTESALNIAAGWIELTAEAAITQHFGEP